MTSDNPNKSKPLQRFTVLDLTRVRAGPTATRQLADWGANVIKVESPEEDNLSGPREGFDFQNLNREKRSIILDLKQKICHDAFLHMVKKADVVVENYRPDVKHRLGIDYERLSEVNPALVYASISGYGQTGPYAHRPGVDQIAQGMGGLMSITGLPGQGPVRVGVPIADLAAGLYCALGVLTALLEREVSEQGQWVQTSLLEAQIALLDMQAARWLCDGVVPGQAGNNHPTSIPMGLYETQDRPVNIGASGGELFQRLCDAIDRPDLPQDVRFNSEQACYENQQALNNILDKVFRCRPAAHWIEVLNKAGVPCGPVYAVDEMFADPHVEHLEMSSQVDHQERGKMKLVSQPVTMSRTPYHIKKPAPDRGAHTKEVLREFGFSDKEMERITQS